MHERALHDLVRAGGRRVAQRPARSAAATSGRSPSCASSHAANASGSNVAPSREHEPGHHLVAGLVVGHAVHGREHDVRVPCAARPRSGRPGSSRRRPGSSRRCGRRSRGSRRRPCSRGRPTSTSRSASSSRSPRRCCSSPRTDRRPAVLTISPTHSSALTQPAVARRSAARGFSLPSSSTTCTCSGAMPERAGARRRRRGSPRRRPRSRRTRRSPRRRTGARTSSTTSGEPSLPNATRSGLSASSGCSGCARRYASGLPV